MEKAYEKIVFVNDQAPDLDADNLNSISDAIDTIDDRVVAHDTSIASKADKTYTDTELAKKSDKSYVDTELAKKADKTYVDTELDKKTSKTYVDDALALKANSTNPSTSGSFNHNGNIYADDFYYFDGSDGVLDGGGLIINTQTSVKDAIDGLDTRISTNTTNISQNTADITALKNKPSGITLTSASPLTNSTASAIVGIDVDGCSTQDTTYGFSYVQGNISVNVGNAINQALTSQSAIRCTSDIKQFASGVSFTCTSGYEVIVAYATSASGNIESIINWCTSFTTSASGYYRIVVRKASGANIVPSEAETVFVPTPTNPISIVDASGEVVAHTVNLTDKQTTGSNLALPKPLPIGTYTISFETDMESNSFRLSNSTDTSKDSISSGSRVSLGNNRYAITLTTTFESNYYSTNANGGTYVKNIMIEQGTTASDYVAYASNKITLPTLRSVGSVKDELIVNADGSGQIIRRVGVSSVAINRHATNTSGKYRFVLATNAVATSASIVGNAMCNVAKATTSSTTGTYGCNDGVSIDTKGTVYLYIESVSAYTIEQFNEWSNNNNLTIYYELATPTTTTLTASEVSAIRALKTYNGTTIIDSALEVKSVSYNADTKKYIDDKFVYSTEETLIGSWEGVPLYRKMMYFTSPSVANTDNIYRFDEDENCEPKLFSGTIYNSNGELLPLNFYLSDSEKVKTSVWDTAAGKFTMNVGSAFTNKECKIIIDYVKPFDYSTYSISTYSNDEAEG